MIHSRFPLIVIVLATTSTFAAVGVPLHGHGSHVGHDQPHFELGHHDHDASYAQGEERLGTRAPRDVAAPTITPTLRAASACELGGELLRVELAFGRAPPDPSSPRAPPA